MEREILSVGIVQAGAFSGIVRVAYNEALNVTITVPRRASQMKVFNMF